MKTSLINRLSPIINLYLEHTESMSFGERNRNPSIKSVLRRETMRKPQNSLKHCQTTSKANELRPFQIDKLLKPKICNQLQLSGSQQQQANQKWLTTDESNNQKGVNMHESIYAPQKLLNSQQFQQPLSFRLKKFKGLGAKRQAKTSKIQNLNFKLSKMNQLVRSQEKQLQEIRNAMSQRELHRLVKIHSTQKLELLETMNRNLNTSLKCIKK